MPSLAIDAALDAAGHMGLDEAVLLLSGKDELILRFYHWQAPSATFGYSMLQAEALREAALKGIAPDNVVRRSTGGGLVFHDEDVTFSLVFPWERLCSPYLIYKNIHRGVHLGLKSMGWTTALWSPANKGKPVINQLCFSAPEPIDLVDERGHKVLGGALRKRGGKGLYQGSLRPPLGFLREDLRGAVAAGLALEFGKQPGREIQEEWFERGKVLAEKYRSEEWGLRR